MPLRMRSPMQSEHLVSWYLPLLGRSLRRPSTNSCHSASCRSRKNWNTVHRVSVRRQATLPFRPIPHSTRVGHCHRISSALQIYNRCLIDMSIIRGCFGYDGAAVRHFIDSSLLCLQFHYYHSIPAAPQTQSSNLGSLVGTCWENIERKRIQWNWRLVSSHPSYSFRDISAQQQIRQYWWMEQPRFVYYFLPVSFG